jgi:hypothetical protein
LGAPNFPVLAFKVSIDFATLGSVWACPVPDARIATKHPAAIKPRRKSFPLM